MSVQVVLYITIDSMLPYLYFYGPQQVRLKLIFIGKLLFIGVGAEHCNMY